MYACIPGGSVLNHNFIWRVPDDFSVEAALSVNQTVVGKLIDRLSVYHTTAMKKEFMSHYGLLRSGVKPFVLRIIYHEFTNDASGSQTNNEEDIYERVREVIASEDLDII